MTAIALAETQRDSSSLIELIKGRFETDRVVLSDPINSLTSHDAMFCGRERFEASPIERDGQQGTIGQRQDLYAAEVEVSRAVGMTGSIRHLDNPQRGVLMTLREHLVIAEDNLNESGTTRHAETDPLIRADIPSPFDYNIYPRPIVFGHSGNEHRWDHDRWPPAPDFRVRIVTPATDEMNSRMVELQRRLETLCEEYPPSARPTLSIEHRLALQTSRLLDPHPPFIPLVRPSDPLEPSLDETHNGRPSEGQTPEQMTQELICAVCFEQKVTVTLVPCGHLCLCEWCANTTIPSRPGQSTVPRGPPENLCPLCRQEVTMKLKVHYP